MKITVPEFYGFYNGKADFPSEREMKLSDAFIKLDENLGYNSDLKKHIEKHNFPLEI